MWKLACISRVWILFKNDEIIIVARFGKIYSPEGSLLAVSKLAAYASTYLGVPKEVFRMTSLDEALMAKCTAVMNKLPPEEPRQKKTAPPPVSQPTVQVRKETEPPKLMRPVIARKPRAPADESVKETHPTHPPEPPENPPSYDSYRGLVKEVAESLDCQTADLAQMLLITGKDEQGRSCLVSLRHLEIIPMAAEDPGEAERNRQFADRLKTAVQRKRYPPRPPVTETGSKTL